ncbi:hypothetical protein [Methylobacterium sp. Gmos1]
MSSAFDFSRPHPGSGLLFGKVSDIAKDGERTARAALEHTCAVCGSFDASRGFKPAGIEHLYAEPVWACSDQDCRRQAEAMVTTTFDRSAAA